MIEYNKNKKEHDPNTSNDDSGERPKLGVAAHNIARTALSDIQTSFPDTDTENQYREQLKTLMANVAAIQQQYLEGIIDSHRTDRGLDEEGVANSILDAMNKGKISKVVRGMSLRAGGMSILMLDGQIPPGVLDITVDDKEYKYRDGKEHYEVDVVPSEELDDYVGADPEENDGFSVVEYRFSQQQHGPLATTEWETRLRTLEAAIEDVA